MRGRILLYALTLFFLCTATHVVIWRTWLSRISSALLVALYLVSPPVVLLGLGLFGLDARALLGMTTIELMAVLLLHASLSAAYIASYPAARVVSPTLDILLLIQGSPDRRMTEEEIKKKFAAKRLVKARIDDLTTYRLVTVRDGAFELQPAARIVVLGFLLYRRMLGMPMGEG